MPAVLFAFAVVLIVFAVPTAAFLAILPAYAFLLASITALRALWRRRTPGGGGGGGGDSSPWPWRGVDTSFFRGEVHHARRRPFGHTFRYPLHFCVVDLDEAPRLFGEDAVHPPSSVAVACGERGRTARGALWPLSTLMLLRDVDHLKNAEGMRCPSLGGSEKTRDDNENGGDTSLSMRERIFNLLCERTGGKLDLRTDGASDRRRVLLVTHLMYFGYCFNPVSFYFVLQTSEGAETEIEAVVVEVSNTPWNEMSIYVCHPDSVDIVESEVIPSNESSSSRMNSRTYRYRWHKNFHVSPFMAMDHDYDWRFRIDHDRIKVEMTMNDRGRDVDEAGEVHDGTWSGGRDDVGGCIRFAAGFDVRRDVLPSWTYPFQLAVVIARFPMYCFVIQLWIHYQAARLLIKGAKFVPHPEGSETAVSRAIALVMGPVFAMMDTATNWRRRKGLGKIKCA